MSSAQDTILPCTKELHVVQRLCNVAGLSKKSPQDLMHVERPSCEVKPNTNRECNKMSLLCRHAFQDHQTIHG